MRASSRLATACPLGDVVLVRAGGTAASVSVGALLDRRCEPEEAAGSALEDGHAALVERRRSTSPGRRSRWRRPRRRGRAAARAGRRRRARVTRRDGSWTWISPSPSSQKSPSLDLVVAGQAAQLGVALVGRHEAAHRVRPPGSSWSGSTSRSVVRRRSLRSGGVPRRSSTDRRPAPRSPSPPARRRRRRRPRRR